MASGYGYGYSHDSLKVTKHDDKKTEEETNVYDYEKGIHERTYTQTVSTTRQTASSEQTGIGFSNPVLQTTEIDCHRRMTLATQPGFLRFYGHDEKEVSPEKTVEDEHVIDEGRHLQSDPKDPKLIYRRERRRTESTTTGNHVEMSSTRFGFF